MNTDTTPQTPEPRPIGFWLRTVDRLLTGAFDVAFEGEPVDRRDWMILNRIDGTVDAPRHPRRPKRFARLARLGWIAPTESGWALTDSGREAKERLAAKAAGVRARVAEAAPADDLATTLRTLESIARELGWTEGDEIPPRRHPRRERVERLGHGRPLPFDARLPHPRRPFGDRTDRACAEGGEPRHRRHGRPEERAFERGFLAGLAHGHA